MKGSVIRARVDDLLKAQASAVLASCGLEMSDALRLFLIQVVNQGGLPFPVRQVARHASAKKLNKMKRNSQARDRALVAQGGAAEEILETNQPLVEVALTQADTEEIATAQDHKQKHAARRARQQAAKAPEA
jgi:addiction module RelB/DinJ family antitoxin